VPTKARTGRRDVDGRPTPPRRATRRSGGVTFFLRSDPSGPGWTWRLFARTGSSGQLRLIHAADRTFPTRTKATDRGRAALATAWAAAALSRVDHAVRKAG
jgi:hypothetical protein